MFKRLALSLVLMGLAAFSLGAGAVAWFSDSANGQVTIQAGTPDIEVDVDHNCDGTVDFENVGEPTPFGMKWQDPVTDELPVPGDTEQDCFDVHNVGDGELTIFAKHSNVSGPDDLKHAFRIQYNVPGNGIECSMRRADDGLYVNGRGCQLGTIANGESLRLVVDTQFLDTGTDQNHLIGESLTFDSELTGYTG